MLTAATSLTDPGDDIAEEVEVALRRELLGVGQNSAHRVLAGGEARATSSRSTADDAGLTPDQRDACMRDAAKIGALIDVPARRPRS